MHPEFRLLSDEFAQRLPKKENITTHHLTGFPLQIKVLSLQKCLPYSVEFSAFLAFSSTTIPVLATADLRQLSGLYGLSGKQTWTSSGNRSRDNSLFTQLS